MSTKNKFAREYNFQVNIVYNKMAGTFEELPDNSVDLVVSYLPCPKHDRNTNARNDWLAKMTVLANGLYRVTDIYARICFFYPMRTKYYVPVWPILLKQIMYDNNYLLEAEIVWFKGAPEQDFEIQKYRTPIEYVHDYIFIFAKKSDKRVRRQLTQQIDTPTRNELKFLFKSVWLTQDFFFKFAKNVLDVPTEAAYRLIRMYSERGDVILTPFARKGTIPVVALKTERKYVAYEQNVHLYNLINMKLQNGREIDAGSTNM